MLNTNELTLWTIKAVPGYNESSNPYTVAVDYTNTKLLLVNMQTRAIIEIAYLKRNHPEEQIMQGSI